jgi:DHA1 family multidrug resistance protein-like MFS transporter
MGTAILTRRQARLLLPLGAAVALSLTGDQTLYAVLPNQIEVVGISLGAVGVLLGANRLIRIPGNLLAGALNDRMARRRLFLLGLLLGVLSTLGYGLVRGFWPLLMARLLWGTAWALINVTGYNMVLDWSTPNDRGRITGLYQMAFLLGLAISPVLGGLLTDALGFRPAVRICAAISALGLALAFVALPETRVPPPEPRPTLWGGVQLWRIGDLLGPWRQALRPGSSNRLGGASGQIDRRILLAAYVYFVTFFVNGGVLMSTISLYLGQRWGANNSRNGLVIGVASLAGLMLALRALLGMVAGPVAGAASDRLRDRWPVVRLGVLLGTTGFVILALPGSLWTIPAGVALVALSAGGLLTALTALVGDLAPKEGQGITIGGLATAGDIGSATGPLVAYALAVVLDLRWVYLLCAIVLASGFIATLRQGRAE